jgi:hypothetical protein
MQRGAPPHPLHGDTPRRNVETAPCRHRGQHVRPDFGLGDPLGGRPLDEHQGNRHLSASPSGRPLAAGTLSRGDTLATINSGSFALSAEKNGKIRARYGNWDDARTIERHQELVFVWRDGQVVAIRPDRRC